MQKVIQVDEPIYGTGDCDRCGPGARVQYHGTFKIDTVTKSIDPINTWDYADGRTCYFCGGHVTKNVVDLSRVV